MVLLTSNLPHSNEGFSAMSHRSSAPHSLDLVIDFVNTVDLDRGEDELLDAAALSAWLADRGLLAKGERAGAEHLARARELREALRATMLANNGGPAPGPALGMLEQAAR